MIIEAEKHCASPERKTDNALFFTLEDDLDLGSRSARRLLFASPNLFPQSVLSGFPDWLPKKQMTLGLDLQGGSHILLQIERQDLVDERLETTRDEIRTLLRDAKIGYTGLTGSGSTVQVRIRDAGDARRGQGGAAVAYSSRSPRASSAPAPSPN